MPSDPLREAIEAVDMALARQELLAIANAAHPVGRAIIQRVRAFTAGRACEKMPGARIPVPERHLEAATNGHTTR